MRVATMDDAKLISMANQIASFFRSYPDDEAEAGIRQHIQAFWTPKMRAAIRAEGPHDGIDPLVATALRNWPAAESPIAKEVGSSPVGGQMASDAG